MGSGTGPDFSALADALAQARRSTEVVGIGGDVPASAVSQTVGNGIGGASAAWLLAGAFARAESPTPLPRTVNCPSCARSLPYGHRFCGYCGDPMDKTLS